MNTLIRIFIAVLVAGLVWFLIGLIPIAYPFGLICRVLVVVVLIVFCLREGGLTIRGGAA